MATPNKLDLSLDDIIKLNKREAQAQRAALTGESGRGKGKGRGGGTGKTTAQQQNISGGVARPGQKSRKRKGRGGGGGSGSGTQQKGTGGAKTPQQKATGRAATPKKPTVNGGTQQKAQRLRQKAKKILQAKNKQAVQSDSKPVSDVKLRLGTRVGEGKRAGQKATVVQGTGNRPGSRLKALRALKTQRASIRGRGGKAVQREALKQAVGRGKGRGRDSGATQQKQDATPTAAATPTPTGRGRGKGRRGSGARRGGGSDQERKPIEVSTTQIPTLEPIGVDIPLMLCAEHHTSKSLHNRFTPKTEQRAAQRMVQRGGRTVNFRM